MPRAPAKPIVAMRIMALVCVVLALMCSWLAYAWKAERDAAACWRTAAEFQLRPEGDCESFSPLAETRSAP